MVEETSQTQQDRFKACGAWTHANLHMHEMHGLTHRVHSGFTALVYLLLYKITRRA